MATMFVNVNTGLILMMEFYVYILWKNIYLYNFFLLIVG